jgi:subtilisin-like proprotein convertase family protein
VDQGTSDGCYSVCMPRKTLLLVLLAGLGGCSLPVEYSDAGTGSGSDCELSGACPDARLSGDGGIALDATPASSDAIEGTPDGASTSFQLSQSATPNIAIPDGPLPGLTSTLVFSSSCTIQAILIDMRITHTFVGDVIMNLKSPAGTDVTLQEYNDVYEGNGGLMGTYPTTLLPVESMDQLVGQQAKGTWTLTIRDGEDMDVGTFHSWGIRLSCI